MAPGFILGAFFWFSCLAGHASVEKWAQDPQWLNLVHYKKTVWGTEGQADGVASYLAVDGKKNPESELRETLKQFLALKAPFEKQSALCLFPARYNWLKTKVTELKFDPLVECADYREFVTKVNAKSVSLIFSSYFINSPASAFGHTFLRFNSALHRQDDQDQAELLDYGINYAAVMDTDNALVYAAKSMLGLFPGTFTAIPYYYKVREYNDFESRDLWEYKLSFTQPQIDRMVEHLWELGPTHFDYKFFTENCSYHVLSLMEVGNPKLKLTDKLPSLYVIPIDTVRIVAEEKGLTLGSRYRPSVLSRLEKRTEKSSQAELNAIRNLVENPLSAAEQVADLTDVVKKAERLDAAVDAFDFLYAQDLVYKPKETNARRHHILTQRAITDHISSPLEMTPPSQEHPENGHRSQRIGAGFGYRDSVGTFETFSMRFALHDLLDPLPGQPTFSEIHFAGLTTRVQQTGHGEGHKLYLDNLDFFRVSSFQPVTAWQNSLSWTAKFGARTIQDNACDQCLAANIDVGGGASVGPRGTEHFVAFLTKLEADYSDRLKNNARVAVGPEIWARLVPSRRFSLLGKVGYKWSNHFESPFFVDQIFTRSLEVRYHANKDWSLALTGEGYEKNGETVHLGFYRFF